MADQVLGGRYRLERHLARGGMGEVYVAHDQLLNRQVAVKALFPELAHDAAFVERFRREAQAAAGLNHPNIVSVYDFGDHEGVSFIVMEYVDGRTLRDIIKAEGPMEPDEAVDIAAEIAAALGAAHAQGLVHRDVKPPNVLIAGADGTVKVADFGIARAANALDGLTMPGQVIGTATYLSPEQAQGQAVDHRSDLYSLGMVLYEMLTGRPPFMAETPVAVAYKQVTETPPPPSSINARVSPKLDAVVAKAMAKDPEARHRSAEQLRAELLALRSAPEPPPPPPPGPDVTQAMAPAAAAGVAETGVIAAPVDRTSVLQGPEPPGRGDGRAAAADDRAAVYRRRRLGLLALLVLLVVGGLALIAATRGGGGTATVPPVVGLSVPDAVAELGRAGLKPDIVEQDRAGAAGVVAEQDPLPGNKVNKNSTVKLLTPRSATTTVPGPTTRPPPATTATTAATTTTRATTTTAPTPTSATAPPTTAGGVTTTTRPTTTT